MFELVNQSHWQAGLYPGWNAQRAPQLTLVVKAGFWYDKRGTTRAMNPCPAIVEADSHYGDPLDTSLQTACETVPFKQGGELLCYGTAHPPSQDVKVMEIKLGLRRGESDYWHKTLRVSGPRHWRHSLISTQPSEAETLQPLSLRYEFAYGGRDHRNVERCYESNPVGVGFSATSRFHPALKLPQIECGPDFLNALTQRPTPAGFGPLASHWQPRMSLTPEIDKAALALRLCPIAQDLAPDLYNAAPLDQRFGQPFQGGETLLLQGLLADAERPSLLITLPAITPQVWQVTRSQSETPLPMICDTLVIRGDEQELHLIWRAAIKMPEKQSGWIVIKETEQEEAAA